MHSASFDFAATLRSDDRVRRLVDLARPLRLHLVGGCLRDAFLGRTVHDLDLVVEGDAARIAEAFAEATRARLVRLGGDRFGALRLVDERGWIDLWDLEYGDLVTDLWRRDFTVNAIAVGCDDGSIVDPTGGLGDLELRLLRATRTAVFEEDPLRVLRLARFALSLPELTVDAASALAARDSVPRLASVAPERAREELDRILASENVAAIERWLSALDLAPLLFDGRAEPLRRWLATPRRDLPNAASPGPALLTDSDRLGLRWAALASRAGGGPRAAGELLRGAREKRLLARPTYERACALLASSVAPEGSETGMRLWLFGAGTGWPAAVTLGFELSSDDAERTRWRDLATWARKLDPPKLERILAPTPLLDGLDVQRILEIGPGPRVGGALAALIREQVAGRVRSASDAEAWLRGGGAGPPGD
jgi:hypothetical protein